MRIVGARRTVLGQIVVSPSQQYSRQGVVLERQTIVGAYHPFVAVVFFVVVAVVEKEGWEETNSDDSDTSILGSFVPRFGIHPVFDPLHHLPRPRVAIFDSAVP